MLRNSTWMTALFITVVQNGIAAAEPAKLIPVAKTPAGISPAIAQVLNPQGQQVMSGSTAVCSIWLVKELPVKPDFKPTLAVKYPLIPGQLVGLLEVSGEFTDFRGQDVAAGVYTLRYGQQPVDGNHVGTSDLSDFLLAVPAKSDEDPGLPKSTEALFKLSAKVAGSNHPAIYSLLPPKEGEKSPNIVFEKAKEYLILNLATSGQSKEQTVAVPLRLIIVGKSES